MIERYGGYDIYAQTRKRHDYVMSVETKKKISLARRGKPNPKHSAFLKQFYKEHPDKHANRVIASKMKFRKGKYASKGQLFVYRILEAKFGKLGVELEYPIRTEASIRFADIGIPALKIDVEFDNPFWHQPEKDIERDKELAEIGWKTIRVTEEMVEEFKNLGIMQSQSINPACSGTDSPVEAPEPQDRNTPMEPTGHTPYPSQSEVAFRGT